jgi:hypothetical protein
MTYQFPVLRGRRSRLLNDRKLDELRRVLWRAFQHGSLTEEELASTLERLEFAVSEQEHRVPAAAEVLDDSRSPVAT